MDLKESILLSDDPSSADEFGSHSKIANLISKEIVTETNGRSIAIIGDWGAGKSTVIKLLDEELSKCPRDKIRPEVFIYDAWSHQGDPLRRSFLDDFIRFLGKQKLLKENEIAEATDKIWNRTETTTTTSEPVLRAHSKLLLLALALIPLGMKFFEIPAGSTGIFEAVCLPRNIVGVILLTTPVILLALFGALNKWGSDKIRSALFGVKPDDVSFSVLSFFFQKVQGSKENKFIKTPADSIVEFKNVFHGILDLVYSKEKNLRIVIVVDNIDRVPPDQAREFWSTMQTFFGAEGGTRQPRTKRYWLVAPFSVDALSFVFDNQKSSVRDNSKDPETTAKAYIDKTFSIAFFVPPPILGNWRKYLLDRMKEAFPKHEEDEIHAVREAFDLNKSFTESITPRELKLFVNALVILYRLRGDELFLPVMASFLLHRASIVKNGITADLLKAQEVKAIEAPNWQVLFAALYFGVSIEEGGQLLLQEPILEALNKNDIELLRSREKLTGFLDVLPKIVRRQLTEGPSLAVGKIAQLAGILGELDCASKPELAGTWRALKDQLEALSNWDGFDIPLASGINAIISHIPEASRPSLRKSIAHSISKVTVPIKTEGGPPLFNIAQNWVAVATAIISPDESSPTTEIPGPTEFRLEALQQLAVSPVVPEIKAKITLPSSPDELSKTFATEISSGRFPRTPESFISFVVEQLKLALPWKQIINAAVARLRVPEIKAEEARGLVILLISVGSVAKSEKAFADLKNISLEGHLSNLLFQHQGDQMLFAAGVVATILTNPEFERNNHIGASGQGDDLLRKILSNNVQESQMERIISIVFSTKCGAKIYQTGIEKANVAKIAANIVQQLVKRKYLFDIEPQYILDHKNFLEDYSEILKTEDFLAQSTKKGELLTILAGQPFEIGRSNLYHSTLGIATHDSNNEYLDFLKQGIEQIQEADWQNALNSPSGPFLDLVELCTQLRKIGRGISLTANASDAILDHVRNVVRGKITSSEPIKKQMDEIFGMIVDAQRQSLVSDIVDDMASASDAPTIRGTIGYFGQHIPAKDLFSVDSNRITRRIFNRILAEPDEVTASWMSKIIAAYPTFLEKVNSSTNKDFLSRLESSLNAEGIDIPTMEAIESVAALFKIPIPARKDKAKPADEPPQA